MDEKQQLRDFHIACQNIVDHREEKSLNWAVVRAEQGLASTNTGEVRTRALYIVSNITHWRGDIAKETKAILKRITN